MSPPSGNTKRWGFEATVDDGVRLAECLVGSISGSRLGRYRGLADWRTLARKDGARQAETKIRPSGRKLRELSSERERNAGSNRRTNKTHMAKGRVIRHERLA